MTQAQPKKSDLGVRVVSALVMVTVAGTALWLGGWEWTLFVAAVALGVLWEWWGLTANFVRSHVARTVWAIGGIGYVGTAALALQFLRNAPSLQHKGIELILIVVLPVIATDVGAYFAGRAIGGPKIAPSISPSKTWAGLLGGMVAAGAVMIAATQIGGSGSVSPYYFPMYALIGALIAIVAQCGDFFESWMKRKAGVKDSGSLLPGHGGLFDRADGLLAVMFAIGTLGLMFGR